MKPWPLTAEEEFWRHKCRDSFWWCFRYAWGYDFNPEGGAGPKKWCHPETHKPLCDWFEAHIREWLTQRKLGNLYQLKLAIIIPREMGKSTFITCAGLLWLALNDPELSAYIDGETMKKAKDFLKSIKMVMDGEDKYSTFSRLYGSWQASGRKWTGEALTHAQRTNMTRRDDSLAACAVEQGITSYHPDVWCFDDPTTYEKIKSHSEWLTQINDHVSSMESVFGEGTLWIWPGTRYGDNDHFGKTFRLEGVKSVTGMKMPDFDVRADGQWHVYYLSGRDTSNTTNYPEGEPTIPHIWSHQRMKNLENRDPMRYAAQVLNNPLESPVSPLTRKDVDTWCTIVDDGTIPWKRMMFTGHIDKAYKSPESMLRGDDTSFTIWGHMQDGSGDIYHWGSWGSNQWQADDAAREMIRHIVELRAMGCRLRLLSDEPETGGNTGLTEAFLRTKFAEAGVDMPAYIQLKRIHRLGSKEERLVNAANFWKSGHVKLPTGRPGREVLIEQMIRIGIGGSTKSDYADAAADVFHKDVYNVMQAYRPDEVKPIENPFDEVLKGGVRAMNAADLIAQLEAENEALYNGDYEL